MTDLKDPGCSNNQDNNEGDDIPQCKDGKDNDSDGLVDLADPGCTNADDRDESDGTSQCQDRRDNDGDGLIDAADPGCSNPQDNNEGDEVAKLQAAVECVYNNLDGTFTAYFGYDNLTGQQTTVANNQAAGTINAFSPGEPNRGQPTSFKTGRSKGAVAVTFNGNAITWTLRAPGSAESKATASRTSPACLPVQPVAECIDLAVDGFRATLGYNNPNEFEIKVAVGGQNGFVPTPADRGQPNSFFPGRNRGVFTASFKTELAWTLSGQTATVNAATPVCPGGCIDTATSEIKGALDQVALDLATLTKQSADILAASARQSLGRAAASRAATDAQRAKRRADLFVEEANSLTVDFPAVTKTCPNAPQFCKTVDRFDTIEALKGLYANQRNAIKRIIARSNFRKTKTTKRDEQIVNQAKGLENQGLLALGRMPRFATECK